MIGKFVILLLLEIIDAYRIGCRLLVPIGIKRVNLVKSRINSISSKSLISGRYGKWESREMKKSMSTISNDNSKNDFSIKEEIDSEGIFSNYKFPIEWNDSGKASMDDRERMKRLEKMYSLELTMQKEKYDTMIKSFKELSELGITRIYEFGEPIYLTDEQTAWHKNEFALINEEYKERKQLMDLFFEEKALTEELNLIKEEKIRQFLIRRREILLEKVDKMNEEQVKNIKEKYEKLMQKN